MFFSLTARSTQTIGVFINPSVFISQWEKDIADFTWFTKRAMGISRKWTKTAKKHRDLVDLQRSFSEPSHILIISNQQKWNVLGISLVQIGGWDDNQRWRHPSVLPIPNLREFIGGARGPRSSSREPLAKKSG